MKLELVTPPVVEPVSVTEAKEHLRLNHDAEDERIGRLISAARAMAEKFTSRALCFQAWRMTLEHPGGLLTLQPSPVLTAVATLDGESVGSLDIIGAESKWPEVEIEAGSVIVDLTCGYDGSPSEIPQAFRQAILLYVEMLYDKDPKTMDLLKSAAEALLLAYSATQDFA